jgi:hypothetical protein
MFARPRSLISAGALGAVCGLLAGCGSSAPGPAATRTAPAAAATHAARNGAFSHPLTVDNPMFPLAVGTQFTYQGRIVEGGESKPHSVTFTVTNLTKMVDGVQTVVAWDRDFLEGELQEQELAFFAQDDQGNVWNFGEYPEEYENGKFTGAPSTWIRGADGAYGGIHMLSQTCLAGTCYKLVLVVDETSPNDPTSGHQIKYYSPPTGLIQVGARGGDSQEFLTLTSVRHLGQAEMAKIRTEVKAMDQRAYKIKVYRTTKPAKQRV